MLSRVADSLYWMSRNCERAEHNAHILSIQLIKMLEASKEEILASHDWEIVLGICGSNMEYERLYGEITLDNVVDYIAFSNQNPNSISSLISCARENARITRNSIPNDLWEVWNDFYLYLQKVKKKNWSLKEINTFLNRIKTSSMTAAGIIDSSMTRSRPYDFMKIGKWLERAEKTAIILNVIYQRSKLPKENGNRMNEYHWQSALQFVNGYEAYLKSFPPLLDPRHVFQLLVSDLSFPRSIRYCMEHVWEAAKELEGRKVSHYSWEMYASIDNMMTVFNDQYIKDFTFEEMGDFLIEARNKCLEFGNIFSKTYYLIEPEMSM